MMRGRFFLYLWCLTGGASVAFSQTPVSIRPSVRLGDRLFHDPHLSHPRGAQPGSTSCASCHQDAFFVRTDRSSIPFRIEGPLSTLRNTPPLIGVWRDHELPKLFHADGEFATFDDLVLGSFSSRNLGWFAGEKSQALAHVTSVLRREYATEFSAIPNDAELRLRAASAIAAYLRTLDFKRDLDDLYNGSPYDAFLAANHLPAAPGGQEGESRYSQRLVREIQALKQVRIAKGFGMAEWRGLQVFIGRGQCIQCHSAPSFSDFRFHNIGVSQTEYDRVHGVGKFGTLAVPTLAERNRHPEAYLPATDSTPGATGRFAAIPTRGLPGRADLGAWNTALNASRPKVQYGLRFALCPGHECTPEEELALSFASFKTPILRGLAQSDPYFHNGSVSTLSEVIAHYSDISELARHGKVRGADRLLQEIWVSPPDVADLVAFLQSLNDR